MKENVLFYTTRMKIKMPIKSDLVEIMRWSNCSDPIPPPGTPGDITFFALAPPLMITFEFRAPPLPGPHKELINIYQNVAYVQFL